MADSASIQLSGGDLVRKFNDGDDGSLPTGRIKADRMYMPDWRGAARKTQRNQKEYMGYVGEKKRREDLIVRDAPVFLTTDDSEEGCGVLIDENGNAIELGKAVFGYDQKVTQDSMNGFYMGVVSNGEIHQCVPVDKKGDKPEDLDARRARAWKYLARVAQIEQIKEAAKSDAPLTATQSADMVKTINELQNNQEVRTFLYDRNVPKEKAIQGISKGMVKLAKRYPRLMKGLKKEGEAKKFATKMYECAQKSKKDLCDGTCGWMGYTDPLTGEKSGVCFPGPLKTGTTDEYEVGANDENAIMRPESGAAKTVGDLLTTKRLTAPERAVLDFWTEQNAVARKAMDEDQMRVWRRLNAAQSPSAKSRLGGTLGGGEVPSVFSTTGSDAASQYSAGHMRVF